MALKPCRECKKKVSTEAAEMLRKYPTNACMIGCDSNWK